MSSLKESGIVLCIIILFLAGIKFFQSFPFEKEFFIFQSVIILALIVFTGFYVFQQFYGNRVFDQYSLYLIFISFFFPLFSAFRAAIVFGQPPVYGLLRERIWIMSIAGVLIIYNVTRRKWTVQHLRRAFHFLAWGTLALFLFVYLFLDPGNFEPPFVKLSRFKGINYSLNPYFIVFGIISCFTQFISYRDKKSLIRFLPFMVYIVFFDKGRGFLVCVLLIMLIIIIFRSKYTMRDLVVFSLILVVGVMSVLIFFPHFSQMSGDGFQNIFESFNFRSITLRDSVTVRVYQLDKALDFVGKKPGVLLWGAGNISQQWNNGFSGKFNYFFPSDLGIAGALFLYGFFGIMVIAFGLKYVFKGGDKSIAGNENFFYSIQFFLIYIMIRSILTGMMFVNPAAFVIPASIFYIMRTQGVKENG